MLSVINKRAFLSAVLLVGAAGAPSTAFAADEWCEGDPAVVVVTPRGNAVTVFVTNGAEGLERLPYLALASISYTAVPTRDGSGTTVRMEVLVPSAISGSEFRTRSVASTGPLKTGVVLDSAEGRSGSPMRFKFLLPVP